MQAQTAINKESAASWRSAFFQYARSGNGIDALKVFLRWQGESLKQDDVVFSCVLNVCGKMAAAEGGMEIHHQLMSSSPSIGIAISTSLIDMYAKCGKPLEARKVFDVMLVKNVISWGAMIAGYVHHGLGHLAVELYAKMEEEGIKPDRVILLFLVKACGSMLALTQGKLVHDQIVRNGMESDLAVGSTLVDFYAKCGSMNEAFTMFSRLPTKNVVTWNVLIGGFVENGHSLAAIDSFKDMQEEGLLPTTITFLYILKACASIRAIDQGKCIHYQLVIDDFELSQSSSKALIDMYGKCGLVDDALGVFNHLSQQDIVSWSALMAGYALHGYSVEIFRLFRRMLEQHVEPDAFVFSTVLKACANGMFLQQGKFIHELIKKSECDSDIVVSISLIDMYIKCGVLAEAKEVFEGLPCRTAVVWSAMIAGCVQHDCGHEALDLFSRMLKEEMWPESATFISSLKGCNNMKSIESGKLLHYQIVCSNLENDITVGNALLDMYIQCGSIEDARSVFDKLNIRDIATWSTMIIGYVQNGNGLLALDFVRDMQGKGMNPDRVSLLCVTKACGSIAAIGVGRLAHHQVVENKLESDTFIGNTLVDMYTKCSRLEDAFKTFKHIPERTTASYNAMITCYAEHGCYNLAMKCFKNMQCRGFQPDVCTYTGLLSACSQGVLVDEGYRHFKAMREEYGLIPSVEHLNCMVDLLGQAGYLQEAARLLRLLPISPDITSWMSLLMTCQRHGHEGLAKQCFN